MRNEVLFLTSNHTTSSSPLLLEDIDVCDIDVCDIGIQGFKNGHLEGDLTVSTRCI